MENAKLKPIGTLLFEDVKSIEKEEKRIKTGTDRLNSFVEVAQGLLGPLDNEQRHELWKRGRKFIEEQIKSQYPFPNGSDKFNLEALGMDPEPLYKFYRDHGQYWHGINFRIDEEGIFIPEEKQSGIETHKYFIETERQQKILYLAEKFQQLFEQADELKAVPSSELDRRTCKLLLGEMMKYEKGTIVPDVERIAMDKQFK
tara:strand:+ start:30022 stop:30624 length:603 start_codon:yes stop_codon:yes gene_type:complete